MNNLLHDLNIFNKSIGKRSAGLSVLLEIINSQSENERGGRDVRGEEKEAAIKLR